MIPARYMWTSSCHMLALKSASNGSTSTTSPFSIRKPVGPFIQPLTAITKNEPVNAGDHDREARQEMHSAAAGGPSRRRRWR